MLGCKDTFSAGCLELHFGMSMASFSLTHLSKQWTKTSVASEVSTGAYIVRFGSNTSIQTAAMLSLAEGTVYLSLCNIKTEHLFWPGPVCKEFLKNEMAEFGFPGCIGIVDGTLIWLV